MFNGQNIRRIAESKGVMLKDIYTKAGINKGTFSTILTERGNPTSDNLEAIADVLGCRIDDFFDRKNEKSLQTIGHHVNGNGNNVSGDISLSECQKKLDQLEKEIGYMQTILKEKEALLNAKEELLKNKDKIISMLEKEASK